MVIETDKARHQATSYIWLVFAATALLLIPAVWNGFPLVFANSGAYLMVAWTSDWPADRSGFYGLFLRPLSLLPGIVQVWLWTILQCAAVGATILLAIRSMAPSLSRRATAAILVLLVIGTTLPWHAAQLMPDAFSGICVLAVWLACNRDPDEPGTPLLWLTAYLTALTHYTHLVLLLATGATTLAVAALQKQSPGKQLIRRAIVCTTVTVLVAATQVAANGVFLKRWSVAPVGSAFLFARLHEDGLTDPWLARHCALGETPVLCRLEPDLPRDSQQLLWGNNAAFLEQTLRSQGGADSPSLAKEIGSANWGSIAAQPLKFAAMAVRATARQFVSFQLLDDQCPAMCGSQSSAVYGWIREHKPSVFQALVNSRQVRGTVPKHLLREVITSLTAIALIFIPMFGYLAWRRRDALSCSLLATVSMALVANAFVTGALSDVHDRYQSRVVWLAPFTLVLMLTRWHFSLSPDKSPANRSTNEGVIFQTAAAPKRPSRPSVE